MGDLKVMNFERFHGFRLLEKFNPASAPSPAASRIMSYLQQNDITKFISHCMILTKMWLKGEKGATST
jgi:hypothetical protein